MITLSWFNSVSNAKTTLYLGSSYSPLIITSTKDGVFDLIYRELAKNKFISSEACHCYGGSHFVFRDNILAY